MYTTITIIIVLVILYKKSTSNFFEQDEKVLENKRQLLIKNLEDKGINLDVETIWLEAFDAFKNNKKEYRFDGETIIADRDTVRGYASAGGNHDYRYQLARYKGVLKYITETTKADIEYGKDQRKLGIAWLPAWSIVVGLILIKPLWVVMVIIKGKTRKITNK